MSPDETEIHRTSQSRIYTYLVGLRGIKALFSWPLPSDEHKEQTGAAPHSARPPSGLTVAQLHSRMLLFLWWRHQSPSRFSRLVGTACYLYRRAAIRCLSARSDFHLSSPDKSVKIYYYRSTRPMNRFVSRTASVMEEKEILQQPLLIPEPVDLLPHQENYWTNKLPLLAQAGLEVERFGTTSYVVQAIPAILGNIISLVPWSWNYWMNSQNGNQQDSLDTTIKTHSGYHGLSKVPFRPDDP